MSIFWRPSIKNVNQIFERPVTLFLLRVSREKKVTCQAFAIKQMTKEQQKKNKYDAIRTQQKETSKEESEEEDDDNGRSIKEGMAPLRRSLRWLSRQIPQDNPNTSLSHTHTRVRTNLLVN